MIDAWPTATEIPRSEIKQTIIGDNADDTNCPVPAQTALKKSG